MGSGSGGFHPTLRKKAKTFAAVLRQESLVSIAARCQKNGAS